MWLFFLSTQLIRREFVKLNQITRLCLLENAAVVDYALSMDRERSRISGDYDYSSVLNVDSVSSSKNTVP